MKKFVKDYAVTFENKTPVVTESINK
jgi:hypothetical protein